MEIKGTGVPLIQQQPQQTESVQQAASVAGSQTVDQVVVKETNAAQQAAASLPPPPVPETTLDEAALRGAESFATQLNEMGAPAKNGPDLMAAFLKLQILQGDVDRNWTNVLSEIKTKMSHLTIENARAHEHAAGGLGWAYGAAQRAICQQSNADVRRAADELKKLLDETLMEEAVGDKDEDKDEKAVGEEEIERKFGKSSLADVDAAAAVQLTSSVAAEAGGVSGDAMTMLSIDAMRPTVAGAVTGMVGNNSAAAELRREI